jgi:hypothetical protein
MGFTDSPEEPFLRWLHETPIIDALVIAWKNGKLKLSRRSPIGRYLVCVTLIEVKRPHPLFKELADYYIRIWVGHDGRLIDEIVTMDPQRPFNVTAVVLRDEPMRGELL